jgi:hypothetical protein
VTKFKAVLSAIRATKKGERKMITRETVLFGEGYKIRFTVYDDVKRLVAISNDKLEVGASSNYCNNNWNKGLAEAVDNISTMLSREELGKLFYALGENEFVDKEYRTYLKNYYDPCIGCPYDGTCDWDYPNCQ